MVSVLNLHISLLWAKFTPKKMRSSIRCTIILLFLYIFRHLLFHTYLRLFRNGTIKLEDKEHIKKKKIKLIKALLYEYLHYRILHLCCIIWFAYFLILELISEIIEHLYSRKKALLSCLYVFGEIVRIGKSLKIIYINLMMMNANALRIIWR